MYNWPIGSIGINATIELPKDFKVGSYFDDFQKVVAPGTVTLVDGVSLATINNFQLRPAKIVGQGSASRLNTVSLQPPANGRIDFGGNLIFAGTPIGYHDSNPAQGYDISFGSGNFSFEGATRVKAKYVNIGYERDATTRFEIKSSGLPAPATFNVTDSLVLGSDTNATVNAIFTGASLYVSGDFDIAAYESTATLTANGSYLDLGGSLALERSDASLLFGTPATRIPVANVVFNNTTLVVGDTPASSASAAKAGIMRRKYPTAPRPAGSVFTLSNSTIATKAGRFLTIDAELTVNQTTIDTTGGNAMAREKISGGTLIKTGPGVLTLAVANAHGVGVSEALRINGGVVEFGVLQAFGVVGSTPRNVSINNGGLRWLPGNTADISSRLGFFVSPGFDTNGNDVTFASPVSGVGDLTKQGEGVLTLAAANSYNGNTNVLGGLIAFGSTTNFGVGNITLNGGGLQWAGAGNTLDLTAKLNPLGIAGGTFDTNGKNISLGAAPLTGPGSLKKTGAGTLTLVGAHPFTGGILAEGGTLTLNGTFANKASLRVGSNAEGSLNLSGTGTTLGVLSNAILGETAAGKGAATVGGSGVRLNAATALIVGQSGRGALTILNGGNVSSGTSASIAALGGSQGTVNVSGPGSVLQTGGYLEVGTTGNGELAIGGGGAVNVATTTAVGLLAGSLGTANVTGAGSSLQVGSSLFVGYQSTGVCTVGAGGAITAWNLILGQEPGGSGTFLLNPGGTLNIGGANGIAVGGGSGGFALAGGTLRITGGNLTTSIPFTLSNASAVNTNGLGATLNGVLGGAGGLIKTGAGTLTLGAANSYAGGTTITGGQVLVSAANRLGTGGVAVSGGSLHSTGAFSRDSSVVVVGAASTLSAASFFEFGTSGASSLSVAGGAQASTPSSIAFGVLGGAQGRADVSGAGSVLTSGTTMFVGYLGGGGVAVGSGGVVAVGAQLLLGSEASGSGSFDLNSGGTLAVGGLNGISKGAGSAAFNFKGGLLKVAGASLSTAVPMTVSGSCIVDTNGLDATLAGPLSGPGDLTKTGAGVLAITAANTLTGSTGILAGTLGIATTTSLGSKTLFLNGGTLDLSFVGTATVQSLRIDGVPQLAGIWGGLGSSATYKTSRITGPGLLQVVSGIPYPTFNPAADAGLSYDFGGGVVDLATATGATPPGGVFSGPGVSGGLFNPATAGYGLHTLTYTADGLASTFTIAVTGGLAFVEEGGRFSPGNLAPSGVAFAKEVYAHPNYSIPRLNDGVYGDSFGWLGTTVDTYAGVRFAGAVTVSRIAFGRDNTGTITDRARDFYLVQFSTDADPSQPSATWTALGALDYRSGTASAAITRPELRHAFSFPARAVTGLRIVCSTPGTVIDEIEIYSNTGLFTTGGIALLQEGGNISRNNLAQTGVAFAKDVIGVAVHAIANVNNGSFGIFSTWIGDSANSFVGVAFGGGVTLDRIALGRDNTAVVGDRTLGRYTLQYTTVASPGAATPEANWTTIGTLDYQSAGGARFASPALRHLFGFPSVTATGIRVLTPSGAAIDELEFYLAAPQLRLEQPAGTPLAVNAVVDFGATFPAAPLVRSFTVANVGTGPLVLGPVTVEGAQAGDFILTPPSATSLAPGENVAFGVTFAAGARGARNATLRVASGDPDSPTFLVGLAGVSLAPAFNAAGTAGLSVTQSGGSFALATATGATPAGGVFAGPGVSGGSFDPVAAGLGVHTLSYTVNGATTTFGVAVTGGLALEEEGGSFAPGNLAPSGIAFAKEVFTHPNYSIPHLNDGLYGDSFSWLGTTVNTYAGVRFAAPVTVNRIAFGRDNTGALADRSEDLYIVESSTDADPSQPSAVWTTVGVVDYRSGGGSGVTAPERRHVFSFAPRSVTGLRVVCATPGTVIDEIEIYPASGLFTTGGLLLLQEGGQIAPGNLAASATAFAKDVFPHPSHTVAHLNDGAYGNSFSWLGFSAGSFAGLNLGGGVTFDRIAFGRDQTGVESDRCLGRYTLQYITAAAPSAATPDASWITLGLLDYQSAGGPRFALPSRRHLFGFPAVTATGIRVLAPDGAVIDELELYLAAPRLKVEQPAGVPLLNNATVDFGAALPGASVTKTFVLSNVGTTTLALGTPMVSGANPGEFTVVASPVSAIAPGAGASFTLTFTASGIGGARTAVVTLPSGDPDLPEFSLNLTATSLVPLFNSATTGGLIIDRSGGTVALASLTGATPPGGTFSGPGVSGGVFDPAVAGFGIHTLVYSAPGTATATFSINVTGGLTLVGEGGTFAPGNLAPGGTAFAKDSFLESGPHRIAHLNDATYGNESSWIGISSATFAGINLGATPVPVNRIAFGRDNPAGAYTDRAVDYYTVQYTTAPNPDAATTAWITIGAVDYRSPAIVNPALRHLFNFPTVNATGVRVVTASAGTAIDEIEIYGITQPPVISLVSDITAYASGSGGIVVFYPPAVVTEPSGQQPVVTYSHPAGSLFPPGVTTVTIAAAVVPEQSATRTFTVTVLSTAYPPEVSLGGTVPVNLATGRTAFAKDVIFAAPHAIASVNNRAYGNDQSWIAGSFDSFVGVNLGGLRIIDRVAFGRDNTGVQTNRVAGTYTLQYTTATNPDSATPDGDWQTIGTVTYPGTITDPALRRLYAFPAVAATGFRLKTLAPNSGIPIGIDELELYGPLPQSPVITPLADITIHASQTSGIVLFYPPTTVSEPNGYQPVVTYSRASGSVFPLGVTTVTITAVIDAGLTATSTFTVTVLSTTNPPDVATGGPVPQNVARGKTAFAKDVVPVAPHTVANVNDGIYGNANSWIADTTDSFVGINLGAPTLIDRVAFGRDHTGVQTSRVQGTYFLQYTTVANPGAATPDASWQTIATLVYPGTISNPARRHLYGFRAVTATGFRLKTVAPSGGFGVGIDELELYSPATPLELWRQQYFGAMANSGNSADLADPDGDGVVNLLEYAFGLNPTQSASRQLPAVIVAAGTLGYDFTGVAGVTYGAEWSTNLATWTPLADAGTGLRHIFSVATTGQSKIFVRLRVTVP